MRVVAALGGNALLQRGEAPLAERQASHVAQAVAALAPIAAQHDLVVTHGNGPQVGLLAIESAADPVLARPYPLDVLGAESQGMVGYLLVLALGNALPGRRVAAVLTCTVVDPADPAFSAPTKFVGPQYADEVARKLATVHGWEFRRDGLLLRRVVASPEPKELLELATIRELAASGVVVVCSGGGGVPVVRGPDGALRGAEAVIDKDLSASLLASSLHADVLLILTDVRGVIDGFGTDHERVLDELVADDPAITALPAGSMGPKVEAARRFVASTSGRAVIGRLEDAALMLDGRAGTRVVPHGAPAPARGTPVVAG